jgi:hypothetical protein
MSKKLILVFKNFGAWFWRKRALNWSAQQLSEWNPDCPVRASEEKNGKPS